MVKISGKSKRVPAKRRYRIEKRIRQHNKKERRENAKAGKSTTIKKTKKNAKSFHIPNKFPGKNELLDMAKQQKEADLENKRRQKELRREKKKENGKAATPATEIDELIQQAQRKQQQFDSMMSLLKHKNPFDELQEDDREKENSRRTFYKEFRKVIEAADVVIEVLDARDPLGSRCPQVEEMIHSAGGNKKLVLLLNKIDLVPKENVQSWLKYLRNQYPAVAFKSSTQNQNQNLSQSSVPINLASDELLTSSACLGADILLKLLNNYTRTNGLKTSITVGIIGLPNVGKSSVINSLKRTHTCMIGSMPGLTRCMQEIKLDKHIKLLDSPGVVMAKDNDSASLALKNCIRVESIADPVEPIKLLLERCSKEHLTIRYKIADFNDATEFLTHIAKKYGKIKKGGVIDIFKAAHLVLNDWNNGKIVYYTVPPQAERPRDTKIISKLGQEFDIDALLKEEQELLDGLNDTKVLVDGMQIESSEPIAMDSHLIKSASSKDEEEESESEEEEMDDDEEKSVPNKVTFKSDLKKKAKHNSSDDDDDVYKTEDIPRTKKLLKQAIKKKAKKEKKTVKMLDQLSGLMEKSNIANGEHQLFTVKNKKPTRVVE